MLASHTAGCSLCVAWYGPAGARLVKGEAPEEAEARSKLSGMRSDRLAAVAQQQAHERSMPVSAGHPTAAAAACD